MNNLLAYSLQIALLVMVAAALPPALGMKMPGVRLAYWQALLVACLALPFLRPWKEPALAGAVTISSTVQAVGAAEHANTPSLTWTEVLWTILAAGVLFRLCWLAAGFLKLRLYRRHSRPFESHAGIRISEEIASPVTFGFFHPVILLPADFADLAPSVRDAVLCHEKLHIERRDWLFTIAEELVRAAFWFHPAIWWVLGEIQLAREQVVDRAVIAQTSARDEYVDALLAIAGAPQLNLSPAPPFLRRRHLKQRVVSILKEVRMSKARSLSALAAGLAMMAAAAWFATGAFPLLAAAEDDAAGVSVELNGAQLMHRGPVGYPLDAIARGIQGTVNIVVKVNPAGEVNGVILTNGPEELQKAATAAVSSWHFAPDPAITSRPVTINFQLPAHGDSTIRSIVISGLSDKAAADLRASLPAREGDTLTLELTARIAAAARAFDEHLAVQFGATASGANITISPQRAPIRVGGNVQQANLLNKVTPPYPPDAKAARVQGTVKLEVRVSPEGKVEDVKLISGPPVLVEAALEAVKQWTYRPTLLNGNPVPVLTTVDINFTLAQ